MKALFTDIDGTLSKGSPSIDFLKKLYHEGIFHDAHFKQHLKQIEDYDNGKIEYVAWVEMNVKNWAKGIKGANAQAVQKSAEEYFETNVKKRIFTDSKKTIDLWKQKGYVCVGISSGLWELISQVKDFLGLDYAFGSQAEIKDGTYTGKMSSDMHVGGGKERIILDFVKKHEIDLQKSAGFGDTMHDIEIFELVENVLVVNPDEELKDLCLLNNWVIADEKNLFEKSKELL